jgi:3-oxoacyl-[acyl-carrier protein] reductase
MSKGLEGKIALMNRWFAWHRRSSRQASGRRWSERGHHVGEGCQGGFRRGQSNERAGRKAIAIQADPTDANAIAAAVEQRAGTAIPKKCEETTLEELDRVIDINVRGLLVTTRAALKHMNVGVASS